MRFSFFTLALALTSSVFAASIEKRAISTAITTCINDLKNIDTQVLAVNVAVAAFTSAAGYSGALSVHAKEQALETLIATATTNCCAVASATVEEANAVLAVVGVLVPDIVTATVSINAKKGQFDSVLLATAIVKADLKSLRTKTTTLDTCLYNAAPASLQPSALNYINTINAAFDVSFTTYGI